MIIPLGMKVFRESEELDIQDSFRTIASHNDRYTVELRFYDTEKLREHSWTFNALVLASVDPYKGIGEITYRDGLSEEGEVSLRALAREMNKLLEET
jgi:hypothetical protein